MPDLHHCPGCGDVMLPVRSECRKRIAGYQCLCGYYADCPAKPHIATESVPAPKGGVRGPRRDKAPQKAQDVLPGLRTRTKKTAAPAPPAKGSHLEALLESQLKAMKCEGYVREYQFAKPRKWRADFAFVPLRLLVEVDGGSYNTAMKSRHTSPLGFQRDCEKANAANVAGFCCLKFTSKDVTTGRAVRLIVQTVAMLSKSCAVMAREEGER